MDASPYTALRGARRGLVDRLGYRDEVYASIRSRFPATPELLFADRWKPARRLSWPKAGAVMALVEARGDRLRPVPARPRRASGRQRHGERPAPSGAEGRLGPRSGAAGGLTGGSAVASEVIWREVVRLRDAEAGGGLDG